MANAKSRFVRILALALAVLMVVPMALVGCKKDEDGVNKEMLDAAIKEALDAAQAAQDAADKAASDAKDAQDKLDAAQKESDKLKAEADKLKEESDKLKAEADKLKNEVESLKNTTTTKPAPTTTVKVETDADKKVVDDYVAALLNDKDSELNKLLKQYGYDSKSAAVTSKTFSSVDQKSLAAIIADVLLAIQRAHTVDYANQLVASLKTTLADAPTYSERVKEAYDAIDFASDKDVIDVVYAANFVVKALADLKADDLSDDEKARVENEVKAIKAFGDEKINLVDAIATEYYRYTGNAGKIADASIKDQSEIEVLYDDAYAAVATANIAGQIRAIYNYLEGLDEDLVAGTDAYNEAVKVLNQNPKALKVANIVWSDDLETDIEDIEDSYKTWKSEFDNAAAKELYAELCIAFAGEDYILTYEGDILNEKLAAAKERFAQLDAAASEYNKASFGGKLKEIVKKYDDEDMNYLYTNKFTKNKGVDYVDGLLSAWMTKYSFSDEDKNLDAIIGADYKKFDDAKKYVNYINEWAVKAANLDVDAIKDALEEFDDEDTFSYNQYGAVIKSLYTFFYGTEAKEGKDGLLAAEYKGAKVYDPTNSVEAVVANVEEIISEVFGKVTLDEIADICTYRNGTLADYVAEAKDINTAIAKLDPAKADFTYLGEINAINAKIETLFTKMDIAYDMEDGVKVWDLDDINADLVNSDGVEALEVAYDELRENLMGEAASIVENYIAWKGEAEDGTIKCTIGTKTYEIEADPFVISIYSEKDMVAMKAIYETLRDAIAEDVAADVSLEVVTVDGEEKFTLEQVVNLYREMSDTFYKYIMEIASKIVLDNNTKSAIMNGDLAGGVEAVNLWMPSDAATAASSTKLQGYAEDFGITYVYVKSGTSAKKKTDGSYIDVFNTKSGYGYGSYLAAVESVNPELFATYAGEDENRRFVSLDKKAYGAAVKAAVDAAYTKWYSGANSDSTAFLCNEKNLENTAKLVSKNIKLSLANGLWNIADEFEIGDEKFSFKLLPFDFSKADILKTETNLYDWTPSLVVYDEDGEVVADNKIILNKGTANEKVYTISLTIGKTAIIDLVKDDKGTTSDKTDDFYSGTGRFTELPEVVISESHEEVKNGTPETVVNTIAKFTWADSQEEVLANWAIVGKVQQVKSTSKYGVITEQMYTKILEAYEMHKFYKVHDAVWNIINNYKNKDGISADAKTAIEQLALEYSVKYKKVSYSSMTIDELWKALDTFEGEATAIIKQNP